MSEDSEFGKSVKSAVWTLVIGVFLLNLLVAIVWYQLAG